MSTPNDSRKWHWETAYSTKQPGEVSWFQDRPVVSLELIAAMDQGPSAALIDVGGGASTLADALLEAGYAELTVLDLAESALAHAKTRLQASSAQVEWIAADVTAWKPGRLYDIWHDRAVLHFLTQQADQAAYANTLKSALRDGGWAIIGGFAQGGPTRCSGLDIVQHNEQSLGRLLGDDFQLRRTRLERHLTPWGSEQLFAYHVFQRSAFNRPSSP